MKAPAGPFTAFIPANMVGGILLVNLDGRCRGSCPVFSGRTFAKSIFAGRIVTFPGYIWRWLYFGQPGVEKQIHIVTAGLFLGIYPLIITAVAFFWARASFSVFGQLAVFVGINERTPARRQM